MIKTLSSYYKQVPLVSPLTGLTCTEFTLKIYVWNGLKNEPPLTASYEITETNPEFLTETLNVNISRYINDFIDFKPNLLDVTVNNGDNQLWAKTEVYYNTENASELNIAQLEETELSVKGYGYAMDGINPQTPTNKVFLSNREYKVSRNTNFIVPILADEDVIPPSENGIVITNITLVSGDTYSIEFTYTGNYDSFVLFSDNTVDGELSENFVPTSPQNVVITISAPFTSKIIAQETTTGEFVESNLFNFS